MTNPEIPNTQPSESTEAPSVAQDEPVQQPLPKTKLPDWKPLGAVRDYFTEQMKQDGIYGR